mmetsp:Transcript_6727/g.11113  ORF Transcript_6727/g.11113 Transcript_6727/m.11113 type:complete len:255 (-) Transcript_6727:97-861(-)
MLGSDVAPFSSAPVFGAHSARLSPRFLDGSASRWPRRSTPPLLSSWRVAALPATARGSWAWPLSAGPPASPTAPRNPAESSAPPGCVAAFFRCPWPCSRWLPGPTAPAPGGSGDASGPRPAVPAPSPVWRAAPGACLRPASSPSPPRGVERLPRTAPRGRGSPAAPCVAVLRLVAAGPSSTVPVRHPASRRTSAHLPQLSASSSSSHQFAAADRFESPSARVSWLRVSAGLPVPPPSWPTSPPGTTSASPPPPP